MKEDTPDKAGISEAMDRNPLTGFAGTSELQKILFKKIDSKEKFAVGLVDPNNLTAFNHKYGFEKGDSVIRQVAAIITNKIKEFGNENDFISHIGGDQFVFVTSIDKAEKISQEIIKTFDEQIPDYYDEDDRKKGFILSKDHHGNIRKFDPMTISISVATNEKIDLIHPLQIGKIVIELRNYIKKQKQSGYLIDRRLKDRDN